MENLMEVEIPEDVEQKLKEMEAKEQEQIEKEEALLKSERERSRSSNPEELER